MTHLEKKRICEVSVNTFTFETKHKGRQILDTFGGGEKKKKIFEATVHPFIFEASLFSLKLRS